MVRLLHTYHITSAQGLRYKVKDLDMLGTKVNN